MCRKDWSGIAQLQRDRETDWLIDKECHHNYTVSSKSGIGADAVVRFRHDRDGDRLPCSGGNN